MDVDIKDFCSSDENKQTLRAKSCLGYIMYNVFLRNESGENIYCSLTHDLEKAREDISKLKSKGECFTTEIVPEFRCRARSMADVFCEEIESARKGSWQPQYYAPTDGSHLPARMDGLIFVVRWDESKGCWVKSTGEKVDRFKFWKEG